MTGVRCHSPRQARDILDRLQTEPRGKHRLVLARRTQMGPFPGDGANRIAGLLNFEALLVVVENPDLIRVSRVAWLLGWDPLDAKTLLCWGATRAQPWTRQLGKKCFALTECAKYVWRTERYDLLATPDILEVVARA